MGRQFKISREDVEVSHFKGSGPGGQNRNKRMTGIRMVHIPTGIVVVATERRSQEQNLSNAFERLHEKLEQHFYRPPKRHATKKTKASVRRRVDEKRKRSATKQLRQRRTDSD
jgi:peptide chain release factor